MPNGRDDPPDGRDKCLDRLEPFERFENPLHGDDPPAEWGRSVVENQNVDRLFAYI